MPGPTRKPRNRGASNGAGQPPTSGVTTPEEVKAPTETLYQRVIKVVDEAVEQARKHKDWISIDLMSYNNWRLRINVNPSGQPALILQAPSLRNRLVLKDEEAIRTIVKLLSEFLENEELKRGVFVALSRHGFKPRRRGVVIEL